MNMNKKELKKQLGIVTAKIADIKEELEGIRDEAQETCDSIEPYENRNDLTQQQQERQEWFENAISMIEEHMDALESAADAMQELENE